MHNQHKENNLDNCVKCSICYTQCPVARNNKEFLGPEQLGPAYQRLIKNHDKAGETIPLDKSVEYCSNCKRCDMACPHGVTPSYYNTMEKTRKNISIKHKVRDWVLTNYNLWGRISSRIPHLANTMMGLGIVKWGMGLIDISGRDFPKFSRTVKPVTKKNHTGRANSKKAIYFVGCYGSFQDTSMVQPTIDILEAYGYDVEVMTETCCGTPSFAAGVLSKAKKSARKNLDALKNYLDLGYRVIVTCPSCGLALKQEYAEFVDENYQAEAERLARNTYDIFEIIEEEGLDIFREGVQNKTAYYHVPCHLAAQKSGIPQLDILRPLFDGMIVNDEHCCGISGTFGFKKEKYELGQQIGSPIFKEIEEKKPDFIFTDCGTCILQIEQGTGRTVDHPIHVLHSLLQKR